MGYEGFLVLLTAFLIFLTMMGRVHERKRWKHLEAEQRKNYGQASGKQYKQEEWKTISSYYVRHKAPQGIDDITWNDLGMDGVFQKLDYTGSSLGEQLLYQMLRTPSCEEATLEEREQRIRAFAEERVRLPLQMQLLKIGRSGKYAIWDYLELLDDLGERSSLPSLIVDFWILAMLPLCFVAPGLGIGGLFIGAMMNFVRYFKQKGEIDPYIVSFSYLLRMIQGAQKMAELLKASGQAPLEEDGRRLGQQAACFQKYRRNAGLLLSPTRMSGSSDPVELILDYVRMIFHLDLLKLNQMLRQVRANRTQLEQLMTAVGEVDALISIQCYRAFLEKEGQAYCIPVFEKEKRLCLIQGAHPLLKNPVLNSIDTKTNVLITGSNASGKSTFLKTVALAALMAQSIHTVVAQQYQACFFRIYSSMALRDDLLKGESYYIVEIKALKRILDSVEQAKEPVLCFVDEVLRGTNTVERIAASVEILHGLNEKNLLCFTATHDIELTRLLREEYKNYHFAEDFQEGRLCFTYQLQEGEAKSRNAIRLLERMGFGESITKRAQDRAEEFLRTGKW